MHKKLTIHVRFLLVEIIKQ